MTQVRVIVFTGQEVLAMLVMQRREGEEVVIGDPAKPLGIVKIVSVRGDRVKVAFDFPREIEVNRREVAEQILTQKPSIVGTIGKTGTT